MALDTLAQVLPRLTPSDLSRLDDVTIRDLVHIVPSLKRQFFGEEAFGMMLFASFCDRISSEDALDLLANVEQAGQIPGIPASLSAPLRPFATIMFRVFMLPQDMHAYRSTLRAFQQLLAVPKPYSERTREATAIEDHLSDRHRGIVTSLLAPALSSCIRSGVRSQAFHRAAAVAVAATRYRIEKGSLPKSLDDLVPAYLSLAPADPFAADAPLRFEQTEDALLIYSVGPNGEDNGGPRSPNAEPAAGNDDVGLRLTHSSARTQ
jgi:hypothetical protein